jgi:hypothetical protein
MSCPQKQFTQCFWQATGELVCEKAVVRNTPTPASYTEFNTFGTPNANYNPNGYLQNVDWYNKHNQPSCNVPCKCTGEKTRPSPFSPPRDYTKLNDTRFPQ